MYENPYYMMALQQARAQQAGGMMQPAQPVVLTGMDSAPISAASNRLPIIQKAPKEPEYTPTSGAEMEADSRSSIDDLMGKLQAQREQSKAQDRNQQWMSFFGKLASSNNPRLLGALGEASGALSETTGKQQAQNNVLDQAALADQIKMEQWKQEQDLKRETVEQGKYQPVKDVFGNVTSIFDAKTGKMIPSSNTSAPSITPINTTPSSDPQEAAFQILDEVGTPYTPVASRQDIIGRNAQAKAYRDAATGAKSAKQQLDQLNQQTGKYTPGKGMNMVYGAQSAIGMGGDGASARAEADNPLRLSPMHLCNKMWVLRVRGFGWWNLMPVPFLMLICPMKRAIFLSKKTKPLPIPRFSARLFRICILAYILQT